MHYLEWEVLKIPPFIWILLEHIVMLTNFYEIVEQQLVQLNLHVIAVDYFDMDLLQPQKDVFSIYDVVDDIKFC